METNTAVARTHPRLAVQAFWLTFARFIAAVLGIATPMLLVRILNQYEYGVYKQVFLFAGTTTALAAFSVGVSAYYYMPRMPERGGQIALNIMAYNLIVGLVPLLVLLFYPRVLTLVFRSGDLQPFAPLLGIFIILSLNGLLVEMIPTAMQDVRSSTLFVVGTQLARAALVVAAALAFRTVRSLIYAHIFGALLCMIVLVRYLYRRFGAFWRTFDPAFFREQLWYALPLGLYGVIFVIRKDLDKYFVSAIFPPAIYAIYAIGWLEVPLINLFLESMLSVMVVRVSSLHKEGRTEDIRHVMASAINRVATIQFPIYAMLLVGGRDLIVFFYTKTYESSAHIFYITITLVLLSVFMYDPLVRAYTELRSFIVIVRLAILIGMFAVLSPIIHHFGMTGAAIAAVLGDLIERVIVIWRVCRAVDAKPHDLRLLVPIPRTAAVTAAAALAAFFVRNMLLNQPLVLRLFATAVTLGLVYAAGFYVMKLPGWELVSKDRLLQLAESTRARLRGATS